MELNIGNQIKRLRRERDITQEEFASVSVFLISPCPGGRTTPATRTLNCCRQSLISSESALTV